MHNNFKKKKRYIYHKRKEKKQIYNVIEQLIGINSFISVRWNYLLK